MEKEEARKKKQARLEANANKRQTQKEKHNTCVGYAANQIPRKMSLKKKKQSGFNATSVKTGITFHALMSVKNI